MIVKLSSKTKQKSQSNKFIDIDNQIVYRFASKDSINCVLATYKVLNQNKRLKKYLPQDISFDSNMVKYRYVFGHNLYTFGLKENILYFKMLFDFLLAGIYFGDLRRENVIYDGKKLTLIDLEWYFLKSKITFFLKSLEWIFSYNYEERKWVK